ncbi:MAG: hypothetical protein LBH11_07340, partial [Propionibacteriaceae bacterium]|nr:hypothetical protein [Propionibacteriaceae bacterium]
MSPTELSVVWAARNIALVRCLTGSNQVSDAEIGRSAAMLATPDMSRDALDWVFGRWSTEAIRSYGWQRSYSDFDAGRLTPSSDSALRGCISEPAILSLTPGGISFSVDGDTAFDKLSELYSESYQKTRQSPLAESLSRQMGDCLAENGYELARGDRDGQPAISVRLPENWTEEEQSRAVLASAACNDRIGLTQQLANLMAGYQEQIIAEHEAELVAIRVEVDRRLALA